MVAFVTPSQVRDYLNEQTAASGPWSDEQIGSNIRTASANLQRWTGRQFEEQSLARTFTTHGRPLFHIPDLRSVSSVARNGEALTVNEGYWLVPDRYEPTVSVGIQLRVLSGYADPRWYLSDPLWWDKGLDLSGGRESVPGDLVITGEWGWDPIPDPVLHACKVLAGWYTLRPSSLLAGQRVTADGAILFYKSLPDEVQDFLTDWRLGPMVEAI